MSGSASPSTCCTIGCDSSRDVPRRNRTSAHETASCMSWTLRVMNGRQPLNRKSEDSRSALTDGAKVRVRCGEPKFRSENAYPGVNAPDRDIDPSWSRFLGLFPTQSRAGACRGASRQLSVGLILGTARRVLFPTPANSRPVPREIVSE